MAWTSRTVRAGVVAVLLLLGAFGCRSSHSERPQSPPGGKSGTDPAASLPASSSPPAVAPAERAVGVRTVTVIDTAASTPARGPRPAQPDRVLPTTVWYPAVGPGAVAALRGPFPLVVFAHGFDVTPQTYAPLLHEVAAAGYVVAAPRFPISASGLPGAPREDDIANQALDVRATISTMLAASADDGWLAGRLERRDVAIMGHSDGGETVAANVLVAADHDPRIRSAVILAGQLPTWGGIDPAPVPTLVVQGSADSINPPILSHELYRRLRGPKWYLDVLGATHLSTIFGSDNRARTVRRSLVAYLDATLRHDARARARLGRLGNEPGVTELTSGPSAPR